MTRSEAGMDIVVKDNGNIHVNGLWLADVNTDPQWLREEAARFIAVAEFLEDRMQATYRLASHSQKRIVISATGTVEAAQLNKLESAAENT